MKVRLFLPALVLAGVVATPASAQPVDVRVKIDTHAIRDVAQEIREALREVFGPEMRLDLQREISSVTREISSATREIAHVVESLSRGHWEGYSERHAAGQRNFPAALEDKETRTFAIGPNGEFDLDNLSGDIRLVVGTGRSLVIDIIRQAHGRSNNDARTGLNRVRVETTHRGDRVTAKTVYPNERQSNYSVSVDYIITAPAGTRITAKTISGDVTVGAFTGDLSINTTSGDIQVTGATHLVHAKTISGDLVLRDVSAEGLLEAGTMSGDVTATNVRARRVDLGSISGSVTARNVDSAAVKLNSMSDDVLFDGDLAAGGRYEFTSHSGTVRLALDGRTGFTFEASTFSGSVRTDLPMKLSNTGTGTRRPNRNVRGTFGDGSATVTATSFSGSVVITKR